ncbi:hypothetical protein ACSW8S_17715 (plasmid) [Clostridium perfringens]
MGSYLTIILFFLVSKAIISFSIERKEIKDKATTLSLVVTLMYCIFR